MLFAALLRPCQAHQTDRECLAYALYREAATEALKGQRAVLDVILARASSTNMSVCSTLSVPGAFSWYSSVSKRTNWGTNKEMFAILSIVEEAKPVLDRRYLWFFSKKLRPRWSKKMHCKVIGNHAYCRK